jgi:hypothetical protein
VDLPTSSAFRLVLLCHPDTLRISLTFSLTALKTLDDETMAETVRQLGSTPVFETCNSSTVGEAAPGKVSKAP